MNDKIKDFNTAHDAKLKKLSKEERAKAGLKKLAQQMKVGKGKIKEPEGLASGKSDKDGKMIIDLDEDHDDER
ncbi:hypothetical protein MJO52_11735 [Microbulbifer variabilis]|uniref:Uncharacterized protein n=1 Tax=Microbulbifer variabilis TaxID=266805 RepID=A0ABY4V651_9GAMM|nr:hypothetical protein [Microbulbifer variabilis]USD19753.1 hypothetical protein MJO52_11735 [Microbulbifer variabilis]